MNDSDFNEGDGAVQRKPGRREGTGAWICESSDDLLQHVQLVLTQAREDYVAFDGTHNSLQSLGALRRAFRHLQLKVGRHGLCGSLA